MARQPKKMKDLLDVAADSVKDRQEMKTPVWNEVDTDEEKHENQDVQVEPKSRAGRPRNRTFTKKDAIPLSVYFPAEMKDELESASFFGKVDQSDIVRAAVKLFMKEHSNGSQLKPSGITIVRDYITETTKS